MTDRKKIMVIDDEPDTLTYFTSLLEDNGYSTTSAVNGDEALLKVRTDRPDLITLDISMPEMSGVKFYRTLREDPELKGIPIIIITGISDSFQDFISSRKQVPPPEGYLSKPVDEKELLEVIADRLKLEL